MGALIFDLGLILASYLFGSLPVLYAVGRRRGFDLRTEPDMHLALWHRVGHREGLAGILFDLAKGPVPVLLARWLERDTWVVALAGVAVVTGQMWPVFLGFRGEKGNSTGLGMMLVLSPATLVLGIVPVAVGALVRTVPRFLARGQSWNQRLAFGGPPSLSLPLGVFLGFGLMPVFAWRQGEPAATVGAAVLLFVLIEVRRVTEGLQADLATGGSLSSLLLNRAIFDRGRR